MNKEIGWLQTFTGKKFYPLAPKQEDISIIDIAWSLSGINRYLNHTNKSWSVGKHSILGALIIWKRTANKALAKWFLLHDASEAYLGDIIKPLKLLPEFAFYREKERALAGLILERFGLISDANNWDEPQLITDIDTKLLLYIESNELRQPLHPDSEIVPGNSESVALGYLNIEKDGHLREFNELLDMSNEQTYQRFLYEFNRFS